MHRPDPARRRPRAPSASPPRPSRPARPLRRRRRPAGLRPPRPPRRRRRRAAERGAGSATRPLRVGQLGATKVIEALLEASGEDAGPAYAIEYSLFPAAAPAFIEAVRGRLRRRRRRWRTRRRSSARSQRRSRSRSSPPKRAAGRRLTVEIFAPKDSPIARRGRPRGQEGRPDRRHDPAVHRRSGRSRQAGLTYDDISPVNLPPPDALTAFQAGDVDADRDARPAAVAAARRRARR